MKCVDPEDERRNILALHKLVSSTEIGRRLILGGSSGLSAASGTIPALTEDVDLLVDSEWVEDHDEALLVEMERIGFKHQPGTCTFFAPDGQSVDLVGYSKQDSIDRIGGSGRLPVMVFGDASLILADPEATEDSPSGGLALSAAALAAIKLLTVRVEKGSKDKLQALLLTAERERDKKFLADLRRILSRFEADRIQDALADAQVAFLAISGDAQRADEQSKGYAQMRQAAGQGLKILRRLVGAGSQA